MPNQATQPGPQSADVCVIVRTCGRPLFLCRALRSISGQTVPPRQVVVIDEGGQGGGTRGLLENGALLPPGTVEVIENPAPAGRGAALNQGLAAARTRWIAVLDDDDTWDAGFLERTTGWLEAAGTGARGVVAFTAVVLEKDGGDVLRETGRYLFNPPGLNAVTVQGIASGSQFTINAFVYSREAALALGGYRGDLPVQEDWEFNIRFLQRHPVGLLPETLAFYHRRPQARGTVAANTSSTWHETVRQQIIDGWLRAELEAGRFGLGHLCLQAGLRQDLDFLFRWKRRIRKLLLCLGLWH